MCALQRQCFKPEKIFCFGCCFESIVISKFYKYIISNVDIDIGSLAFISRTRRRWFYISWKAL